MDLSTTYMGLDLSSPVIAGASPLSKHPDLAMRLEDAGAAAIVMHSLFMEQIQREQLAHLADVDAIEHGSFEATSYLPEPRDFKLGPDAYLEELARLRARLSIPVIASLNGIAKGPWTRHARLLQQAGAHAIELNLYHLPLDGDEDSASVEQRYVDVLEGVRAEVRIPVAVKLHPFLSSPIHLGRRLAAAGANGLVLFNRLFVGDIDPELLEIKDGLDLAEPSSFRLRLLWLAAMSGEVNASLSATGGARTARDVIKAVMAGAATVQLTTALLQEGPEHFRGLLKGIRRWMEENETPSIADLQGSMSLRSCPDPEAFERANYMAVLQSWSPPAGF